MRKIFGTDGIRGVANVHPMTSEVALRLGRAVAHVCKQGQHRHRVLIGKDTRLSGYMLETAMSSGVCSMGVDVLVVGPLPTPGIALLTRTMRADAGVVISASHNPFQDNGIKIFAQDGFKLPDETEEILESLMTGGDIDQLRPTAQAVGKAVRIDDAVGRYIVALKHVLPEDLTLEGVKMVVDCANGAGYRVTPAVFEELGAKVISMGVKPDGRNINRKCGSLHPEGMCAAVKRHGADLGIALDGDADRVLMADEKGRLIDGDHMLAITARHLLAQGQLKKKTVVATVMSNLGLALAFKDLGIKLKRTKVGDRYVVKEMRKGGYNVGGEQSGHLIFLDHSTTGDGVVSALKVLTVMLREQQPLSKLRKVMTTVPQVLLNKRVAKKIPIGKLPKVQRAIKKVEKALGKQGRVLVRYSGTENKIRVMIEGTDKRKIKSYAKEILEHFSE
jgi:phosphoglucosamine mutase